MLPLGANVAGATRVGQALGRGDAGAARRAAALCVALGVSFALFASLLLLTLRGQLPCLFTTDAAVQQLVRDAACLVRRHRPTCPPGAVLGLTPPQP